MKYVELYYTKICREMILSKTKQHLIHSFFLESAYCCNYNINISMKSDNKLIS